MLNAAALEVTLTEFTQSQQSRRAPPTAHAPRHMPEYSRN